jgi:hypothetical protein
MGFGDFANQAFGALTGLGSHGAASAPGYQGTDLDPATKDLMARQQARAVRPESEFAADLTRGTGDASSMLNPEAQKRENSALGMATPDSLSQAINNKAMRAFQVGQADIGATARAQAPLLKQQATMAAAGDLMRNQQVQNQNIMQQNESRRQQMMIRNSYITSMFSGLGSVAGMVVGSASGGGNISPPGSKPIKMSENSGFGGGFAGGDISSMGSMS